MSISRKLTKHIGDLSHIKFTETQIKKFEKELGEIIDYINKIKNQKSKIKNLKSEIKDRCFLREDIPCHGISKQEALKNAPCSKEGYFITPKVV